MSDIITPIVIDNGSFEMKVGFGGHDNPIAQFPTIIGRPTHCGVMVGVGQRDSYIGAEAWSRRSILRIVSPFDKGAIGNWDDIEKVKKFFILVLY